MNYPFKLQETKMKPAHKVVLYPTSQQVHAIFQALPLVELISLCQAL